MVKHFVQPNSIILAWPGVVWFRKQVSVPYTSLFPLEDYVQK